MNPAKIGKMDEEVQKWSRKDPQAIKKAMVFPGEISSNIIILTYPGTPVLYVSLMKDKMIMQ